MAPVIIIMVLAQNADVEMELWLVSACCRHTNKPVHVILQHLSALRSPVFLTRLCRCNLKHSCCEHVTSSTSRHLIVAEGFELLSNDPDHQPVLFPPKQTSPLSRKALMESHCAPPGPLEPGQGSVSVPKSAQTGETGPSG